jgi:ABC-2 type transport system permease protein
MRLSFAPIYKRELRAYFQNPSVYVALAIFLAVSGWFVFSGLSWFVRVCMDRRMQMQMGMGSINFTEFVVKDTFGIISFLFLFVIPLLTMRLFAEEKKTGTFELLVTCPVTDWGLVLGKYLAALTIVVAFLIVSLVFPVIFSRLGDPDLGLLLVGMAYVAFGTFASTLTENQIIAGVVTFFGLLAFYLIGDMGIGGMGTLSRVFEALSIRQHSDNLIRGKILIEDITYFVAFAVGFLFLANHVLESRRWRV